MSSSLYLRTVDENSDQFMCVHLDGQHAIDHMCHWRYYIVQNVLLILFISYNVAVMTHRLFSKLYQ